MGENFLKAVLVKTKGKPETIVVENTTNAFRKIIGETDGEFDIYTFRCSDSNHTMAIICREECLLDYNDMAVGYDDAWWSSTRASDENIPLNLSFNSGEYKLYGDFLILRDDLHSFEDNFESLDENEAKHYVSMFSEHNVKF